MRIKKPGASRLTVTVILRDGQRQRRHLRTPPNQYMSPIGIETQLKAEADRVEQYFPGREFRLVPLSGGCEFNFVEIPPEMAPPIAE